MHHLFTLDRLTPYFLLAALFPFLFAYLTMYALNGFDPIKDIPNGVYLTGFFSNYPTQQVMDEIFAFLNEHHLVPMSGKVIDFENIREAIIAQDEGKVNGKIVVKL